MNAQGDFRYVMPILHDSWSLESAVGWDYKQINLLETYFGSVQEVNDTQDIAEFVASETWQQHDKHGLTHRPEAPRHVLLRLQFSTGWKTWEVACRSTPR